MHQTPSVSEFLNTVKDHRLHIERDDGKFRHLTFKREGSSVYHFHITTWPGYLAFTGDMGSFVFSRLSDMFEFFRQTEKERAEKTLAINLPYWAEKLQASDASARNGNGYEEFDSAVFRARVKEWLRTYAESYEELDVDSMMAAAQNEVIARADESEERAVGAAINFTFDGHHPLQDFYEVRCRSYTYRFIWCCYAIVWAIDQYDSQRADREVA